MDIGRADSSVIVELIGSTEELACDSNVAPVDPEAVRCFRRRSKCRTALGSTGATLELYANSSVNPINSTIIEESALPISTTISGSSNSSTN